MGELSQDAARPSYADLPSMPGTTVPCAWSAYGEGDQLGALNLVTEEVSRDALSEARTGQSFALQLPLDVPGPPLFGRQAYVHHVTSDEHSVDDRLDSFFPQSSSQWDALGHALHPVGGLYGGHSVNDVVERGALGIDNVAARGVVTRGVLLDVPRHVVAQGGTWNPASRIQIDATLLKDTAAWANVRLQTGDVLCVRTGWVGHYKAFDQQQRQEFAQESLKLNFQCPGLAPADGIAELVWESGVVAIATDNPGVEPFIPPLLPDNSGVDSDALCHTRLTVALGVMLGEMWDLDPLAEACAADGRYTFLLTSAPLYVPGGIGSPPNAIAIR
jgi:kynurenine formamidase